MSREISDEERQSIKQMAKTSMAAVMNLGWMGNLGPLPGWGNKTKRKDPKHIQLDKINAAEAKRQRKRERNLRNQL